MEKQVGKITSALSSKTLGSLPSTTETPKSTSGTRVVNTCKAIKLRSGNNCEGTSDQIQTHTRNNSTTPSDLEEKKTKR